jgi:RNA polymerase sigma-70 factor (ECF subfamily)
MTALLEMSTRPRGSPALDERQIVARCRAGDAVAWRQLYDAHGPMVFRFLAGMGLRDDERDDACQDVFLAVHRSLEQFRGESRLSTWIYRIAAREAARIGQRRRLRQALVSLLRLEPSPGPADPTLAADSLHLLANVLTHVAPRKRTVFVLHDIEQVPVGEIARIVGCGESTVWSRLHHARKEVLKLARKRLGEPRS